MLRRAAALAVVLLVASPAIARTTRAADARERAAVHWKSGSTRYAAGEWSAALDEFEAGYAAHPSPPFLVNIGQCLRKLDRLDEAALAFRRFLDTHTGSARTRLDVYDALEDVTAELNRRVDALAESAALFDVYLRSNDGSGDPALRAKAKATRDEILRTLVAIDDKLTQGYGVARALALPRAAPAATVERVRQRLTTIAAARSPIATNANQRSARSITHSHIRR
jgi:hypothetical protein